MKLTTENSNTTTKWQAPYIVHYIRDREQFRTQLVYAIGCLLLPCCHCVKPSNSAPGGKASLVIGSRKKRIETKNKCIAFLQTLVQREIKSLAEWAGLPSPTVTRND